MNGTAQSDTRPLHGDVTYIQRRFFSMFLTGTTGEIELRRMTFDPTLGEHGRYTAPESMVSRDIEKLLTFSTNGAGDIFHGINTRKPGAVNAEKKDIAEVTCIGGDLDFKTASKAIFERALSEFPQQPTWTNDSGNGWQVYWFLKTPLAIEGAEQIELVEGIAKGIASRLGGDHIQDITRILRTPGRPNSKYAHKPLCRVLKDDGPRYDINELKQYWEKPSAPSENADLGDIPQELPEKFIALLAKHRPIALTWRGERGDLKDQSGSGYDMAMAALLVRQGFSDNEIAGILRHMRSGKGRDASDAYLSHTIGKARQGMADNSIRSLKEGIGKETNWHPLSAAEILTMSTPQISWVWQDLIPQGALFLLCAFMKVGKSTLAYRVALAIVQGLVCLGRETTKTGVLILAVEEHLRDIRRRMERFGMTSDMDIYVIVDRGQARDLDKIREFIKAQNIGLILIDSLSRWWDVADENNNMEVLRAVSPLLDLAHDDSVGVSIGLIVHERKSGGEDGRGIRGGSSLFGLVDQAIILDRRPGETSNKRLLKTLGRYEDSPKEIIIDYRTYGR